MAIDPRIILGASNAPSASFQNFLANIPSIDQMRTSRAQARQARALLPIQTQLAQAQAETQIQQNLSARDQQRLASVATGAAEVLPFLQNNDFEGARNNLIARRQRLVDQGRPTTETDQALQLLETNPALLQQRARNAVSVGQQLGVFTGGGITPRQREFEQFQALPEDTPGQQETKRQFGQLIGAIAKRPTTEERVATAEALGEVEVGVAEEKAALTTRAKLREQVAAIPEQERVQFLSENRSVFEGDIAESRAVLDEIDRAIEIWETAPGTISGPIASRTPALTSESQELASILAGLGIERLSNFKGATSERELATAFRAGASIEQDAKAGIMRLKKQRRDIERNNERLRGLLNESNSLLRRQPEQSIEQQPAEQPVQVIRFDAQGNIIQ